jgi:hypothetical protein
MCGKRGLVLTVLAVAGLASALAVALAAAHGGRSAPPAPKLGDPAAFIVRTIEEKARGRYADVWDSLYPSHKLIAPRELYVRCELRIPFPGKIVSVHALSKWPAAVAVAGLRQKIPGEAVAIRAVVRSPLLATPLAVTHTFHAVAVKGRWTWILSTSRFRLYSGGGCSSVYTA